VIDIVRMKALEVQGTRPSGGLRGRGHPGRPAGRGRRGAEHLIEKVTEVDDRLLEKYLHGEAITEDEIKAALRRRTVESVRHEKAPFVPVVCGSAFKNKACSRCSTPCDYLPAPTDIPSVSAWFRAARAAARAAVVRRRAVLGARVQDHDRPVRRPALVHPVYSGVMQSGSSVFNSTKAGPSGWAPPQDAREQARGDQGSLRRRHRGGGRAAERDHRRHDLQREAPILLESMDFPEPVIALAIEPKTKADQEKLARVWRSCRPKTRRSAWRPTSRPARCHPGDGRAAPRDHRRPPEARVQRRGGVGRPQWPTRRR